MIIPELHRQPVAINTERHKATVLRVPITDWSTVAPMNAIFVTAAECMQLACEYPIFFIGAGKDDKGETDYAPIAVLGVSKGQNLYVDGTVWRATVLPGQMAMYPLCVARVGDDRYAVCVDEGWSGVAVDGGTGTGTGERLFTDAGGPTDFARRMQGTLEKMEAQVDQTRGVGRRLAALDLLRERRFDATLPDGRKIALDGFFMVDEERVKALPDEQLLALQREGLLGLIHAHWISAGHMRRLLQWHLEREKSTPTAGLTVTPDVSPAGSSTH